MQAKYSILPKTNSSTMKQILAAVLTTIILSASADAQRREYPASDFPTAPTTGGFQWNKTFVGGSLGLGFGTGSFSLITNPEIGYSVADWVDVGMVFNIGYFSQRYDDFNPSTGASTEKYRTFQYGGGGFVRVYPFNPIFLTIQPEVNWLSTTITASNTPNSIKQTNRSTSFIAGVGYSQRVVGQSSFYTLIGVDLGNDFNSPYKLRGGTNIPIVRAGFNVYLGGGAKQ